LLAVAIVIGALSLWYTNTLVKKLQEEEKKKVELWAEATRKLADLTDANMDFNFHINVVRNNTTVPVIMVDERGAARIAASDMRFPNGMAISKGRLIVAESLGAGLMAFDRLPDGTLVNPLRWASFRSDEGLITPDGICADSEGAIWLANANTAEVLRVSIGGRISSRIRTSQVAFSCALGGSDGRDLLIATAPTPSAAILKTQLLGKLEMARVAIPGTQTAGSA